MGNENVNLYGIYSKDITVNFVINDTNAVSNKNTSPTCTMYNKSTTCSISSPSLSVKSGYYAIGWNSVKTATTSNFNAGTSKNFSSNATYYSITRKSSAYTATFNGNGASLSKYSASCYVFNGSSSCSVTSPTITRSGFTIVGFSTSNTATTSSWSVNTTKSISSSVTYYAITKKDVSVTFAKGHGVSSIGGTSGKCTIWNNNSNCAVTTPSITANTYYTVVGWNTSSTATSGVAVGSKVYPSTNTTYYGCAKDTTAPTCSISLSGTMGNNSWYRSNVKVTLNMSDNGDGIGSYGLTTSSSTTYNSTSTVTVKSDTGGVTYRGYVKDKAGNTKSCSVSFKRDATPPQTPYITSIMCKSGSYQTYNTCNGKTQVCHFNFNIYDDYDSYWNYAYDDTYVAADVNQGQNYASGYSYSEVYWVPSRTPGTTAVCRWTGLNDCGYKYNSVYPAKIVQRYRTYDNAGNVSAEAGADICLKAESYTGEWSDYDGLSCY